MTNPFTSLRSASAHFLGSWRVFYGRYFPPVSAGAGTGHLEIVEFDAVIRRTVEQDVQVTQVMPFAASLCRTVAVSVER